MGGPSSGEVGRDPLGLIAGRGRRESQGRSEPLWLMTVGQGANAFFDQRDGRCLLSGYLPGERKRYLHIAPDWFSSARLGRGECPPCSLRPF